jgi:Transposase and inactivated derivatives
VELGAGDEGPARGRDAQTIHANEDREAARAKAAQVVTKLVEMKLAHRSRAGARFNRGDLQLLRLSPPEHHRSLRTNNPLERIMRKIRRRTRVVGAFPDGNSALLLGCARLRLIAGKTWGPKRYMDMDRDSLRDLDPKPRRPFRLNPNGRERGSAANAAPAHL